MRDPNPLNELGTGKIPPELERRMLERGTVFARMISVPGAPPFALSSMRPFDEAVADALRDAGKVLARTAAPAPPK